MTKTATVTILFTDVVGSSQLRTSRGDESAHRILQLHDELVRRQIESCSGREIKTIGDSFMVAFGSARNAVDCAVAIQQALAEHNQSNPDQQIQVRIGMNTGEAIEKDGDLFGAAVDAAARVLSKAAGGQILISETVRGAIDSAQDISLLDRGPFWLKGFPERWRLYEVLWHEDKISTALMPSHIAERTPFVGREGERADLRRFLDSARGGQGSLVMIGGEPGAGKTRITEELAAEADRHGFLTMTGHCYEMEGAPPYIPFVEILQSIMRTAEPDVLLDTLGNAAPEAAKLVPELRQQFLEIPEPRKLPPEQERLFLFSNLRDFFERMARQRPLLLVIEDLHWTDEPTLLLLQHIVQRLHEMPVLVIGTYRDTELDIARSLAKALKELLRQRLAHDLLLKPLPKTEVSAMLQGRSGQEPPSRLVEVIYRETEGNPFFVEEVFKHLAEEGKLFDADGQWLSDLRIDELDVPRGVRMVIGHRLERVSEECRRTLTAAAVIGRGFGFELLNELVSLDEDSMLDAVDEAERAQLVSSKTTGREVQFTFFHELIRQTLLSYLSPLRQQRFHLRAAEALERISGPALEDYAADLAYHLQQAGASADPEKVVRYLVLAGERAMGTSSFEGALEHFDNALSFQFAGSVRVRPEVLYKRGFALRSIGRQDDAMADWKEAAAIYEKTGDAEGVGQVCAEIAYQLTVEGRLAEAYETAQRGISSMGERANIARCRLLAAAGTAIGFTEADYDRADSLFTQALEMTEQVGDEHLLGSVYHRKAVFHRYYRQSQRAVDAGLRAVELLRLSGNIYEAADALTTVQVGMIWTGRFEEAKRIGQEAHSCGVESKSDIALFFGGIFDAALEVMITGNLDLFKQRSTALLEMSGKIDPLWFVQLYPILGRAQFWRGGWEEAAESFQKGVESGGPAAGTGTLIGPLIRFKAYAGERTAVLRILQQKQEMLASAGRMNTLDAWAMLDAAIEGLAALGEWDEAAKLYPPAVEAVNSDHVIRSTFTGLAQTTAGIAAMASRKWEKAEEHYQIALRQAHELPHKIEQPEVRRWYARMLIERNAPGDNEKARTLLTEAIAMYREIGMPKHLNMAEELLGKA